jgi:hypothetical protein
MSVTEEDILSWVRSLVWTGKYDAEEVAGVIDDQLVDDEQVDEAWLAEIIEREVAAKREAEKTWPAVTDCDRLASLPCKSRVSRNRTEWKRLQKRTRIPFTSGRSTSATVSSRSKTKSAHSTEADFISGSVTSPAKTPKGWRPASWCVRRYSRRVLRSSGTERSASECSSKDSAGSGEGLDAR